MSARDQMLALQQGMARSIIGQEQVVERLLLRLLADGNLLLEGCLVWLKRAPSKASPATWSLSSAASNGCTAKIMLRLTTCAPWYTIVYDTASSSARRPMPRG
jgi:hypothetical protein